MITEIWFKTNEIALRLPVLPSEYERTTSASYEDSTVLSLGDVATFKSNGLTKISISSFFPNKYYSFCAYSNILSPSEYIKYIVKWKNEGTPVRVILTGTGINQEMKITDFNYGEKDGTGDIYYEINFVEHRQIVIPKVEATSNATTTQRPTTNTATNTQKTHKVQPGDSLWAIAQKYYGNGSLYPKIKEANWNKYPSLKNNNIIYAKKDGGWVLVIP